jgi:two-component sensor histidine kinase/integral membrane sensor domain MASE1
LNPGPLGPEPSALAGLRYAPMNYKKPETKLRYAPKLHTQDTKCPFRKQYRLASKSPRPYIPKMTWSQMPAKFSLSSQSLLVRSSIFAAAFLGGVVAVGMSPLPGSYHTAYCPTIGLLLAILLIVPRREWNVFFLATVPGIAASIFVHNEPFGHAVFFWFVHHVQALVGALLLQALSTLRPRLESLQEVFEFTAIGGVIASVVGATLSSVVAASLYPQESMTALWKSWASSHLLGTLTTAPLLLTWDTRRVVNLFRSEPRRLVEALFLTLAAGLWSALIFTDVLTWSRMDDYLILPLVMWAPVRFGLRGASWVNFLLAVLANILAAHGYGESALNHGFDYRTILGLQMLLAVSTLSTLALASVLHERELTQERLEQALADKEILHREVHHRVKNNLNLVASLLNLQTDYVRDQQDAQLLEDARRRIVAMAKIHERLTHRGELSSIDFGDYLNVLADEFRKSSVRDDIQIRVNTDPIPLDLDRAISCGLIVNELATNALTHAFPGGRSGEIVISMTPLPQGGIRLGVSDDGIGLPQGEDFRSSSSMGMMVVNSLLSQLDATMEIKTEKGTAFVIDFPANSQKKRVGG